MVQLEEDNLVEYGFRRVIITVTAVLCAMQPDSIITTVFKIQVSKQMALILDSQALTTPFSNRLLFDLQ